MILYFLNKKLVKQFKIYQEKYNYLHSLLYNENQQFIKRIEYIAQVNLLYGEMSTKVNERYSILCQKDVVIENKIKIAIDDLDKKKFSEIRKQYPEFKKLITEFEDEVDELNKYLLQIIRPEEECNNSISDQKQKYQICKQEYEANKQQLEILEKSYKQLFEYIENKFEEFEQLVSYANYDEAMSLIPNISKCIDELKNANNYLPNLCLLASRTIPQMLGDLESEYNHMSQNDLPVNHIINKGKINALYKKLEEIVKNLKHFNYKNEGQNLQGIQEVINKCLQEFKEEKEAEIEFNKIKDDVYTFIDDIQSEHINLCHTLDKVKSVYNISTELEIKKNEFQIEIGKITNSKRSLEATLNSDAKSPYVLILNRTNELKKEAENFSTTINEFKKYIKGLKEDVEESHRFVYSFYYNLKNSEKILRETQLKLLEEKYSKKLNYFYDVIDEIHTLTETCPIDVKKINADMLKLKTEGNSLINSIELDNNLMRQVESRILTFNESRYKYNDINAKINEIENEFYNCEFKDALVNLDNVKNLLIQKQNSENN